MIGPFEQAVHHNQMMRTDTQESEFSQNRSKLQPESVHMRMQAREGVSLDYATADRAYMKVAQ